MKIELLEVENYIKALRIKLEQRGGSFMTHEQMEFIADALEQLPKLVAALKRADKSLDILIEAQGVEAPASSIVKQALKPFANQPQP